MQISRIPSYAVCSPEEAARYEELTEKGLWARLPSETAWAERQEFLQESGYTLRPRYKKQWTPSWIGTLRVPAFCEDSIRLAIYHVMDATRMQDGEQVSIKIVKRPREIEIARTLCTGRLPNHTANHCVPVLDVLPDPLNSSQRLMVTPYLCPFNDPAFETIEEVLDFVAQTLEGLHFMHRQGVAHRDCATRNIMMDGRPLHPKGHHPVRRDCTPDALFKTPRHSRLRHPVKYYFIDFGLSSQFCKGETPLVVGTDGADRDVPELSSDVLYDPFCVDIFILGHVYYDELLRKYSDLEFLEPLISSMMKQRPELRPTATEAHMIFESLCSRLQGTYLRWRLRPKTENISERIFFDAVDVVKAGYDRLKSYFPSESS